MSLRWVITLIRRQSIHTFVYWLITGLRIPTCLGWLKWKSWFLMSRSHLINSLDTLDMPELWFQGLHPGQAFILSERKLIDFVCRDKMLFLLISLGRNAFTSNYMNFLCFIAHNLRWNNTSRVFFWKRFQIVLSIFGIVWAYQQPLKEFFQLLIFNLVDLFDKQNWVYFTVFFVYFLHVTEFQCLQDTHCDWVDIWYIRVIFFYDILRFSLLLWWSVTLGIFVVDWSY